jgi:2-dehydropantoate 2-reductase
MASSAADIDLPSKAPTSPPTWVVVGTGALGSLWAHGLQQAGAPVMVYSRHANDGLEVELNIMPAAGPTKDPTAEIAPQVAKDPSSLATNTTANTTQKSIRARFPVIHSAAAAPPGAIWLIMVKAWQLEPLLRQIFLQQRAEQAKSAPMQLILSHNGMGAADTLLAEAVNAGHVQVYDLVTTHGAWRQSRLSTVHAGLGESWLGLRSEQAGGAEHATDTVEASNASNTAMNTVSSTPQHALSRYAALAESNQKPAPPAWFHTLAQALPPLHWEANIGARRWHKLAINCVINPLATIAGDVNGVLRKNEYQPKIRAICEEIGNLNPYLDADVLVASVQQVIRATANNRCSMLQDSEAGKPTEIDYLNGFICQEGTHLHVATRVNCELWHQLASSNTSKDMNEKE